MPAKYFCPGTTITAQQCGSDSTWCAYNESSLQRNRLRKVIYVLGSPSEIRILSRSAKLH